MLKNVKFETSVFSKDKILKTEVPQIVLVGKSNVGKSSFINALANHKNLAKVGQTPGKTKCLNYYLVDNTFYIVDLPGYGFSKMTKQEKDITNKLINKYITENELIKHIFFLVDIRHNPTEDDKTMYEWLIAQNIPFTIIANKADKIAKTKLNDYCLNITKRLFAKEEIVPFSSNNKINLQYIEKIISESL